MANVYLEAGDIWDCNNSNTKIFGYGSGEKVIINPGVSGIKLNSLIQQVSFSLPELDYSFSQQGNQIVINVAGTEQIRIPVHQNGTSLHFSDTVKTVTLDLEGMKINGVPLNQPGDDEMSTPPVPDKSPWSLFVPAAEYAFSNEYLVSDGSSSGTAVYDAGCRTSKTEVFVTYDQTELIFQHSNYLYSLRDVTQYPELVSSSVTPYVSDAPVTFTNAAASTYLYVQSDQNTAEYQAFITDGSRAGTRIIEDMDPLVTNYSRVDTDNHLVWSAAASQPYGWELFITQITGDSAQRQFTKDINPGSDSGVYSDDFRRSKNALLPEGRLIFSADDGEHGDEPWVSDGTSAGTFMLSDIRSGSYSSGPGDYISYNNEVAFTAYDQSRKLFITDGTNEGTRAIEIAVDPDYTCSSILGVLGEKLFFTAKVETSQGRQEYVYATAGDTVTQTSMVYDSRTILQWGENIAYFSVTDAEYGTELWAYHPMTDSFNLVSDILLGTGSGLANTDTALLDDYLLFTAYVSPTETAWFISDGTATGTAQIGSTAAFAYELLDDTLVYANQEGIFKLDLNAASFTPQTIASGTTTENNPIQVDADQAFVQTASNQLICVTEADLDPIVLMDDVLEFKVIAENSIYAIQNTDNGYAALWFSDGTAQGTYHVADLDVSSTYFDMSRAVGIKTPDVWQDETA